MIKVRVPATCANVGPGFDCLGIALNMYNSFKVEEIEKGVEILGCEDQFKNEDNMIYSSMIKTFEIIGYKPKGIRIEIEGNVPVSRGLGSSASCIVGGIMAANELSGGILKREDIINIAARIEGHPDNTTPAIVGGMTVSIMQNENVIFEKINILDNIKFCALIPNFRLSTRKAREVLPKEISFSDGVHNIGRTALLISSLVNGNFDFVKFALEDRMHQIYRKKLIANYDDIVEKCYEYGAIGVFLSGAGPTIMAVLRENDEAFVDKMEDFFKGINNDWFLKELKIDKQGANIIRN